MKSPRVVLFKEADKNRKEFWTKGLISFPVAINFKWPLSLGIFDELITFKKLKDQLSHSNSNSTCPNIFVTK